MTKNDISYNIAYAVKLGINIITPREYAEKYLNITDTNKLDKIEVAYDLFSYDDVHEYFMDDIKSVVAKFGAQNLCVIADEYNAFLVEI